MFSSKLWDIILNRNSCHNLYYKFVQWKVNQFGNEKYFPWIKDWHDVINTVLYSCGNYCILTIVSGVWNYLKKKALINKNENSELEYVFQNYFSPSISVRDENVT